MRELQPYDLAWIEEPTSPDDLVGHAAIRKGLNGVPVATGEHTANRVMFKQLLQLEAIDVMQIDAARVAGVNENLANLLLAAKFGVRVCPHAGGVGLCEAVQHLSMIDFVAVSGTWDNRYLEFVDHLHEHFVDPVRIVDGRYLAPTDARRRHRDDSPTPWSEYRYQAGWRLIMTVTAVAGPADHRVLHPTTVWACSSTSVCTPWPAGTSGCRTASASTRTCTRSTSSTSTPTCSTPPTGRGSAGRPG